MPTPAYLHIEGERQGLITAGAFTEASVGNIFVEGHEDQVLVQAIGHAMNLPTDPQSGQPSGQRVHQPFTITKVLDKSSPLICTAMTTGEKLKICELRIYRTSVSGVQEHFYTIKLKDAVIVAYYLMSPHAQDATTAHLTQLEVVSFSYRAIEWTHECCGTTGGDDWRKPTGV